MFHRGFHCGTFVSSLCVCVPGFSPTSSLGYTTVTPSVFPPLTANLGMQNGFGNSSLGQLNSSAPGPIGKPFKSFLPVSANLGIHKTFVNSSLGQIINSSTLGQLSSSTFSPTGKSCVSFLPVSANLGVQDTFVNSSLGQIIDASTDAAGLIGELWVSSSSVSANLGM